jgi:4-amino-4-deoxy-L-arabinose transferase-like glycosyltransferase
MTISKLILIISHYVFVSLAKPLRKRAVAALAASVCASSPPVQAGDDV